MKRTLDTNSEKWDLTLGELAQIGYDAYGAEADWKAYDGKPMPAWEELPHHIRVKWKIATGAIVKALTTES